MILHVHLEFVMCSRLYGEVFCGCCFAVVCLVIQCVESIYEGYNMTNWVMTSMWLFLGL